MTETTGGADVLTPNAMVLLQDRPLVPLSAAVSEALHECDRTNRVLQIVTGDRSRITLPLHATVSSSRAQWVVHNDDGYYEGLTGHPMRWDGKAFTPISDARDYAPAYTVHPAEPLGTHLVLTFQARHSARDVLGGHVDHLMRIITGEPPLGWGVSEPLQHPWDPSDLTAHVHATTTTRLLVTGVSTMATMDLTVQGTEQTTLTVGYVPDRHPPVSDLPSIAGMLTAEHPVSALLAQLNPGRADLTTEPRWTGLSAPIGLAVSGAYTGPPGFTRHRIGPPTAPLTWFHLGDGHSPEYWQRHKDLLTHLHTAQPR